MESKELYRVFKKIAKDDLTGSLVASQVLAQKFAETYNAYTADRGDKTDEDLLQEIERLDQLWNSIRYRLYAHYKKHAIISHGFSAYLKMKSPKVYEKYQEYKYENIT